LKRRDSLDPRRLLLLHALSRHRFRVRRTLAQTAGTAVIRLADADILPFRYSNPVDTLKTYDDELQTLLKKKREEITERNRAIADGVYEAMNDPRRPRAAPKPEAVPPTGGSLTRQSSESRERLPLLRTR
jgi:hypothetical protein